MQQKLKERGLARRNGRQLSSAVLNLKFETSRQLLMAQHPMPLLTSHSISISQRTRSFGRGQRLDLFPLQEAPAWKIEGLESSLDVQFRNNLQVDDLEGDGFNPGIFDAMIPTAAHVQRAATESAQIAEPLKSGKAFSASGQWNVCESRIGNAGVTLRAQKQ